MKIQAIYSIENIVNNKVYIGSAINLNGRWRVHKSHLNLNKHANKYLQNAWNKHGEDKFKFIMIELVDNKENLAEREQYWIEKFFACNREFGYNILENARTSLGYKHTKEAKLKLSKKQKEIGNKPPSALGRKHKEETKLLIGKSNSKPKKSTINMKKPKSEKHKKNLSISKTGTKLSQEHKDNISKSSRELDKWPCIDGNKCKCIECKKKRNLYYRDRYQKLKLAKGK